MLGEPLARSSHHSRFDAREEPPSAASALSSLKRSLASNLNEREKFRNKEAQTREQLDSAEKSLNKAQTALLRERKEAAALRSQLEDRTMLISPWNDFSLLRGSCAAKQAKHRRTNISLTWFVCTVYITTALLMQKESSSSGSMRSFRITLRLAHAWSQLSVGWVWTSRKVCSFSCESQFPDGLFMLSNMLCKQL